MAMNPGWAERQAFVTMCGAFACVLDPSVVIAELVPLLVMTATDAVPNVRRELASVIATLRTNRAYATLPDLRDAAARLKNDVDRDVAQTARGCAFEDRGRGGGDAGVGFEPNAAFAPTGLRSPFR
jgi:serine/threonine-protein phosphatase 4 regulatory subunit 1